MSSILLPVGQCGNQIGHELMTLLDSHSVRHPMSHRDGKLRCVCVDSEPKVVAHTLRSDRKRGNLYREDNLIVGQSGRGNNFALGYYGLGDRTEESSLLNRTMDAVRKEVERCDFFAGTIVMHSLTGGTGSGLGARLIETLRDAYPLAHITSVAISPHLSGDSPLQHYNSLLSLAALQRNADCITVFSNDDILRHLISQTSGSSAAKQQSSGSVSLKQMNQLIAASLAGVLLPLGEKPKAITRKSTTNKLKLKTSSRSTTLMSGSRSQKSKHSLSDKGYLASNSKRSLWSASSTISNFSGISDVFSRDEDETSSIMQRQPRSTVSALMRYRGITSKPTTGTSFSDREMLDSSSSSKTSSKNTSPSDGEFDNVTKGNEPWEMLRSVCPEPSRKFASIHHLAKTKVTWEALIQSLLHSTCRYDKDGKQFATLNSLLIARGTGEKPFMDSIAKIEERLKTSLGFVEWNPFPMDYWISQYSAAGSSNPQSLTLCLNSSRIMGFLQDVMDKAKTMYDVGAYVHWYEKHGCLKDDFQDAFATLDGVVQEYRLATL